MPPISISFAEPMLLYAGLALLVAIALAVSIRKPAFPSITKLLAFIGIVLLALAAGEPMLQRARPVHVAVMIDVSPSTRGASWYDSHWLEQRLAELLGGTPPQVYEFSPGDKMRP